MNKIDKDFEELVDRIVAHETHKMFHIPIIGYGFNEEGEEVLMKVVDRRKDDCYWCIVDKEDNI